jgi:hypothetical protein
LVNWKVGQAHCGSRLLRCSTALAIWLLLVVAVLVGCMEILVVAVVVVY